MRHLTTYERKASEAPENKREEGSEALKQDLWIAILLDRIGSRREDNRSDATEHVLKIMVVHDASEEDPVDERTYRSPEKRSSLPRPAKSLTRHIPAAEQEDRPRRPTSDLQWRGIAADCKRVTVLKYFLEALCGQEEPLLAFKGGKYVSMATGPSLNPWTERGKKKESPEKVGDDVIVEAESSLSTSEDGEAEDDIRELRARRSVLTNKLAEQQKRRDKIQAVLQTGGQLQLEVRPYYLVPDTNGFIDHLDGLRTLLRSAAYVLVVPLIVITELDGLAKGQDGFGGGGNHGNGAHVRAVQEKARLAVAFLERGFEAREPGLRALTSRGNQLESHRLPQRGHLRTAGQQRRHHPVLLPPLLQRHRGRPAGDHSADPQRPGPRDIAAFLSWAKVG
ncbi:unnamed protein product [Boreogadus saida]